jgi:hypothetical protein
VKECIRAPAEKKEKQLWLFTSNPELRRAQGYLLPGM